MNSCCGKRGGGGTGIRLERQGQGLLCALGVVVIWTGFQLFFRLSLSQSFRVWDLGALRSMGAFLTALALWLGLPPLRVLGLTLTAGFGFPFGAYAASNSRLWRMVAR